MNLNYHQEQGKLVITRNLKEKIFQPRQYLNPTNRERPSTKPINLGEVYLHDQVLHYYTATSKTTISIVSIFLI